MFFLCARVRGSGGELCALVRTSVVIVAVNLPNALLPPFLENGLSSTRVLKKLESVIFAEVDFSCSQGFRMPIDDSTGEVSTLEIYECRPNPPEDTESGRGLQEWSTLSHSVNWGSLGDQIEDYSQKPTSCLCQYLESNMTGKIPNHQSYILYSGTSM